MRQMATVAIEPRKTPVQARSQATVEAIEEATIQVLRQVGTEALTTTRVAARAGVSVGTLYQYFPNKQALLYSVLELHLEFVVRSVEAKCEELRGECVREMAEGLVECFMTAKAHRMDVAATMYGVADGPEAVPLLRRLKRRAVTSIAAMLMTATDARYEDGTEVAMMLYATMTGTARSVFEGGATPVKARALKAQLAVMSSAYLLAVRV